MGSWDLKPGVLRLFKWSTDFNPILQHQTNAQVWIRIFSLVQEYWRPRILFAIASGISIPISLDDATKTKTLGHFSCVLVDIDLAGLLHDEILVEREGFTFFVAIENE